MRRSSNANSLLRSRHAAALAVALAAAACDRAGTGPAAPAPADAGAPVAAVPAPTPPVSAGVQLIRDADAALQAGKTDEAISLARRALALEPRHPLAANLLGRAAQARFASKHDLKDAALAKDGFERALAANPGFWPAQQNLAELAQAQGHPREAAEYYKKLLEAQPDHPEKKKFEAAIAAAPTKGP